MYESGLVIGLCKQQKNKLSTANKITLAFRGSWVPRRPVYRVIPWTADPFLKRKGKSLTLLLFLPFFAEPLWWELLLLFFPSAPGISWGMDRSPVRVVERFVCFYSLKSLSDVFILEATPQICEIAKKNSTKNWRWMYVIEVILMLQIWDWYVDGFYFYICVLIKYLSNKS